MKLVLALPGFAKVLHLPPYSAGASLKLRVDIEPLPAVQLSSPVFSGGLIEAGPRRVAHRDSPRSSPVFSGGLIEAPPECRKTAA